MRFVLATLILVGCTTVRVEEVLPAGASGASGQAGAPMASAGAGTGGTQSGGTGGTPSATGGAGEGGAAGQAGAPETVSPGGAGTGGAPSGGAGTGGAPSGGAGAGGTKSATGGTGGAPSAPFPCTAPEAGGGAWQRVEILPGECLIVGSPDAVADQVCEDLTPDNDTCDVMCGKRLAVNAGSDTSAIFYEVLDFFGTLKTAMPGDASYSRICSGQQPLP